MIVVAETIDRKSHRVRKSKDRSSTSLKTSFRSLTLNQESGTIRWYRFESTVDESQKNNEFALEGAMSSSCNVRILTKLSLLQYLERVAKEKIEPKFSSG